MSKIIKLSILLLAYSALATAQEQLHHEKKIYISPDQKIFVNKLSPIYFRISNSPEANAPSYLMKSEQTPKYANPMYFDTEGRNTLHHSSAVDTSTKKIVLPEQDVIFEVYADGIAPITYLKLTGTNSFIRNNTVFFGKGLKANFKANDETSGVEATYASINKAVFQDIKSSQLTFDEQKDYTIAYYSVDRVGNAETPKHESFSVDLTPPVTSYEIIGEKKGKVLSSKAVIKLTSKDTLSGVNRIVCSINDGPETVYTSPIPMSVLKDGKSKIQYYAIDNLGNKEEPKVISASTDAMDANSDASSFSYYIDKEAPIMNFEIVGDQYKGKYLFVSGRSTFKINATDEKSGVDKITYSINSTLLNNIYTDPFTFAGEKLNSVIFASVDYVGNLALAQTQLVYVDKISPVSKVSFSGNQFFSHDTLYLTKNTKIVVTTSEIGSGIQSVNYSLNNGNKQIYSAPFTVEKEGYHIMEYHATDQVNNTEEIKKCSFLVDNMAPEIYYHFSVKSIGEKTVREDKYTIYPSNAMLYIAATDNASGTQSVEYRINNKELQTAIPVKGFTPGNYEIEIISYDMLKNMSKQIVRFAIEN